jgi:hypothetical protein
MQKSQARGRQTRGRQSPGGRHQFEERAGRLRQVIDTISGCSDKYAGFTGKADLSAKVLRIDKACAGSNMVDFASIISFSDTGLREPRPFH